LAESTFDRAHFTRALRTGRLGHVLFTRAEVESTNDEVWDLAQQGADEGACVVADAQTRGRGRQGRTWYTAPGKSLALSVLLHAGCEPPGRDAAGARLRFGTAPLVAGVALVEAFDALGLECRLKWPNDVLMGGRKVSGILAEGRRTVDGTDCVVMGLGVNVSQTAEDFPPELRDRATSMALHGHPVPREYVAAAFLNALEPLWDEHQEGDARQALDRWRQRASFWGRPVTVDSPAGRIEGTARDLDDRGGLVIEPLQGPPVTVYAGDLEVTWPKGAA
jgi:BirA family transcriptional regulator, biotin operon repressor / biotin---[acetyl-CoA-carboxylase] ligase